MTEGKETPLKYYDSPFHVNHSEDDAVKMASEVDEELAEIEAIKQSLKSAIPEGISLTSAVYALLELAKDLTRGSQIYKNFYEEAVAEIEGFYLVDDNPRNDESIVYRIYHIDDQEYADYCYQEKSMAEERCNRCINSEVRAERVCDFAEQRPRLI